MTDPKFNELVEIVKKLRKECPWDREQTNESIKAATIEEAYEVVEAIEKKDYNALKDELGDLLLHVVFHTIIASEKQNFTIDHVIDSIKNKLIRRHPHVFGDVIVENEEQVAQNWEQLKLNEGKKSILEGVPRSLPALIKASRIQDKAASAGLDWEQPGQVLDKVKEELSELEQELDNLDPKRIESEFGDVLFSLINFSRFIKVDPESALERTNKKFMQRFRYLESEASRNGESLQDLTLEQMDLYWDQSKKLFK